MHSVNFLDAIPEGLRMLNSVDATDLSSQRDDII